MRRLMLSCFTLLLVSIGNQASAQPAQPDRDPNISVSGTGTTVRSLLTDIEKQTGFVFFYNTKLVDVQKPVTINVRNGSLSAVLGQIFDKDNISYKIMGKQIALYPSNGEAPTENEIAAQTMLVNNSRQTDAPVGLSAQNGPAIIKGVVTDAEDGTPLGYATVIVKGTTYGTMTDEQGNYTLQFDLSGNNVLVFSQLGYELKEVNYNGRNTTVNVSLSRETFAIDNVVVTGYQNIKKETFTGSSVKIMASDLEIAGATDISRMLEGKVAGVSIQNVSGTFGAAPKVRVRGATSINGENKPLWVVDGVVLEDIVNISNDQLSSGDPTTLLGSSVAGINSADIESFDILKDAAATALYGARAMNGVIVITTKRGKQGAPAISYSGNFTVRTKPRYEQFDIMNSADQMGVYAELYSKGAFMPGMVNNSKYGPYGLMYSYLSTPDPSTGERLRNTPEDRAAFLYKYAKANTDWFDLLFTNNLIQEHSLSISSGTERSRTYVSLGFLNDAGATIADKVNRYTANFRNDLTLGERINIGFLVNGSVRQQKAPGSFTRELDVVKGEYSRDFDINPFSYAYNTSRAVRPYNDKGDLEYVTMNYAPFNILSELDANTLDLTVVDLKAQG